MLTPQTRSLRSKASCRSCCKRWVGGVIELRTAQCDLLAGTTVCLMMPGRNSTPLPRHGRILARAQPSEDQRLYKEGALLEDARSLAELKVENDDELAVAYRGEGEAPAGGRRGGGQAGRHGGGGGWRAAVGGGRPWPTGSSWRMSYR